MTRKRTSLCSLPRRLSAMALAVIAFMTVFAAPQDVSPGVSEHALKTALLMRVAKFVEWPRGSFAAANSPFIVCVVSSEGRVRAFDSVEGAHINSHAATVRHVTGDMLDLRQCHVAFFPDNSNADIDYALEKLRGLPVLTVGETEDFAARGGSLALVTKDQRIRFTVNLGASKAAGLAVSSQLLQLATVIGDEGR